MPRFTTREHAELLTIKAACYRGLGRSELLAYVGDRLGPFLRADATCMVELDPPTGYPIYVVSRGWAPENHRPLIEHALLASPTADPGRLVVERLRCVSAEERVPDGDWRRDPYFEYHLLLYGYRHELQVACATSGQGRALLTLTRKESTGRFDPVALRFLDAVAPHVAAGMRAATARESLAAPVGSETGFILLDVAGQVEFANRVGESWLSVAPAAGRPGHSWSLQVFAGLFVRSLSEDGTRIVPSLDVADPNTGATYRLHGERATDAAGRPRVLITLEPMRAHDRAESLTHHGLSEREAQVTLAIVRGETVEQFGLREQISSHTVRQHLKNVYAKLGISSRRELALRLYVGF